MRSCDDEGEIQIDPVCGSREEILIGDKAFERDFKGSRFEWGEVFSRQVI